MPPVGFEPKISAGERPLKMFINHVRTDTALQTPCDGEVEDIFILIVVGFRQKQDRNHVPSPSQNNSDICHKKWGWDLAKSGQKG